MQYLASGGEQEGRWRTRTVVAGAIDNLENKRRIRDLQPRAASHSRVRGGQAAEDKGLEAALSEPAA